VEFVGRHPFLKPAENGFDFLKRLWIVGRVAKLLADSLADKKARVFVVG
jgi:hypothetical protein